MYVFTCYFLPLHFEELRDLCVFLHVIYRLLLIDLYTPNSEL